MFHLRNPDAQSELVCLPDDVLISILEQLDLTTQLKMTHVHIRFLTLMPQVWRSQCRSMTLSLIELHLSDKDLRFFLGSNQKTFQVLRVKMERRGNFDILTQFVFSEVHDFRFSTSSFWLRDSELPRIKKAFPILRTFSPQGIFTGNLLPEFPNLENLTLTHCSNFQSGNLIPILQTCKLKSLKLGRFDEEECRATKLPLEGIKDLELLHCDTGEMAGWFMEHLQHMTNLKQLIFCGLLDWNVVRRFLDSSNRKNLRCVELNASGTDVFFLFQNPTVQIEILKVANAFIPLNGMPDVIIDSAKINQIYLKNCAIWESEDFGMLLENLKTPQILGLDGCLFGFQEYTFLALEIGRGRRSVLHVHLNDNVHLGIMDEKLPMVWYVEGQHSLFELHMDSSSVTYGSDPVSIYFE